MTTLQMKRRHFLLASLAIISSTRVASAEPRRFRVAFANLNEEPGTRIDGLGFTGSEIRRSFELASRSLPVDMIYYDNGGDGDKALGNAKDAVASKVDLLIEYSVRVGGVLSKFLTAQTRRKVLVATLDDASALAAKSAVEAAGRISDCVIVSQGADRSIHGGASEKKEIDPANRGSVVLGSVAYYFDRYGYEILPIALRMLRGEHVASQTSTKHIMISAKNVFLEYPPNDMN